MNHRQLRERQKRRRNLSQWRDRSRDRRHAEDPEAIEVALPHLADNVSQTVHMRLPMLERMRELGLVYEHDGRWFSDDRTLLEEAMDRERSLFVCDFCSLPQPRWEYPCADVPVVALEIEHDGSSTAYASRDAWSACDACVAFIDAGDRQGLALHATERFAEKVGAVSGSDREMLAGALLDVQAAFFANRSGPRRPLA